MPLDSARLQLLLDQGDVAGCVQFFRGASDAERSGVARQVENWLKHVDELVRDGQTIQSRGTPEQFNAARAAALAACSFSTLKALGWRSGVITDDDIAVLADRRPPWIGDYAEHALGSDPPRWLEVRSLVKAGLCPPPRHDNYVLGMTSLGGGVGTSATDPTEHRGRTWSKWNVLTHLTAEPDLRELLWRLFELEGSGELSLAAHDKYAGPTPEHRWNGALVALSNQNVLSRERLLDASLAALDRGFAQFRAGWFSTFHELLTPSLDERLTRQASYLKLLKSSTPPTITFALKALDLIDRKRPLESAEFLDGLEPVLQARGSGLVKTGLKLLRRVAQRDPQTHPRVARLAATALGHATAEVQAAAFAEVSRWGTTADADLVAAVTEVQLTIAPSVRTGFAEWLATSAKPFESSEKRNVQRTKRPQAADAQPPESAKVDPPPFEIAEFERRASMLPPAWREIAGVDRALASLRQGTLDFASCSFTGRDFPRLDREQSIAPVESWEGLVDLAGRLVEKIDDHNDLERLYDGVSRLCDQRPADFMKRTAPLVRRIQQIMQRHGVVPFVHTDPQATLLGVLLAWLRGNYGTREERRDAKGKIEAKYTLGDMSWPYYLRRIPLLAQALRDRGRQLADRVIRQCAVETLCAPTHRGGWIDPRVLVARVSQASVLGEATDLEQGLALLRLAPEGRDEAAQLLPSGEHPFLAALTATLTGNEPAASTRLPDWLKVISRAARGDKHTQVTASFQFQPPCSEKPGTGRLQIEPSPVSAAGDIDLRLLPACRWRFNDFDGWPDPEGVELVRQQFLVHPGDLTPTFAQGATRLARNLDWWQAEWANRQYLEPLLDPDVPLGEMGVLLLTLGLAAKEHGESTLATDIAIAACDDGRLEPSQLGAVLGRLLLARFVHAARLARTLGQVARVSPVHEVCVRIALSCSLRGEPAKMPRDLQALVELLCELVIATQTPVDAAAREFLGQFSGSSKLARGARRILEVNLQPDPARTALAQMQIVSSRLNRAERWLSRITPGANTTTHH